MTVLEEEKVEISGETTGEEEVKEVATEEVKDEVVEEVKDEN